MNFYKKSQEIKDYLIEIRRNLHENPEIGFEMTNTVKHVTDELDKMGIKYSKPIESGVLATIGKGDRCILLRADMDALPIKEEANVVCKSTNENGHLCGHDFHTAMLLGTAKLLKENEDKINGVVKLMFQPAEELLSGSQKMIDAGILENPKVEKAMMVHMDTTLAPGLYIKKGEMATSNNNFRIEVEGYGAHGAMPEKGVDAAFIAAQIVNALQVLVSREISFREGAVLTTGHISAGNAPNIIPDKAIIEGTTRTYSQKSKEHIKTRIPEIADHIAKAFRGKASFEILSDVPAIINDDQMVDDIVEVLKEIKKENPDFNYSDKAEAVTASDDFANVAKNVPAVMMMVGCKVDDQTVYPLHNAKAKFNEDAIIYGPTLMASVVMKYLGGNKWK